MMVKNQRENLLYFCLEEANSVPQTKLSCISCFPFRLLLQVCWKTED